MVHHTIATKIAKAPKASNKTKPMRYPLKIGCVAILSAGLLSCTLGPNLTPTKPTPPGDVWVREQTQWVRSTWSDLPGWEADTTAQLWPALLRSCQRPARDWVSVCSQAKAQPPAATDLATRQWLEQRLQPWRVQTLQGQSQGLITGYFEPVRAASRQPQPHMQAPLYSAPIDLTSRTPYWSRQELDTLPQAQSALQGRALAYVADPLDALMLQIQGSGRLSFMEPDGQQKIIRIAFAGHNSQPYKSIGRWLIEQGELSAHSASWTAIKNWAQKNPKRLNELLWSNPRVVFFREEPLPDPQVGPLGAQGVPLTPGRSIAVDALSMPYGTPVWLDTTEPLSNQPLQRVVMAQDTGSAITGAVRADYFWGFGDLAEQQASRMKQPLRLWALWPR
jgi:membrane-bound lytic murein transglycosylase A